MYFILTSRTCLLEVTNVLQNEMNEWSLYLVTKEFGLTNHTTNSNARNQNRHRQDNIVSKSNCCSLLGDSFLPNGQETWVILFSCILYFSPWLPRSLFSSILIKEQENAKRAGFYGLGLEVGHNVFTYID